MKNVGATLAGEELTLCFTALLTLATFETPLAMEEALFLSPLCLGVVDEIGIPLLEKSVSI